MTRTFILSLLLLAGCAPARMETAGPKPVITRIAATARDDDTTPVEKAGEVRIEVVDGFCRTGDRMPTARRGSLDAPRGSIPTAPALGALPYIPNACPVTAGPLAAKSVVVTYPKKHP